MRKPVAVILFFAFLATQYARQVSYLECKLVNYFSASAVKCDCEKLLTVSNDSPENPLPSAHPHVHPDEWYSMSSYKIREPHQLIVPAARPLFLHSAIADGIDAAPDRPPQFV